ncbi:hypothetical protein V1514DRAFT_370067 [Lipomyces japonicus]|uniref:uncharacterized protein n=1 Tax=Lipomyces japonicus TaxID=56871 RepID=UPI0034CFF7B1
MPSRRASRVIRKPPLWSRISSYPFDLYLRANEKLETIDWDKLSLSVSLPLGVGLDFILVLCRLSIAALDVQQDERNKVFIDSAQLRNSKAASAVLVGRGARSFRNWTIALLSTISIIIVIASVVNTFYVFFRYKTYTFFGRAQTDLKLASTPTAHIASVSLSSLDDSNNSEKHYGSPFTKFIPRVRGKQSRSSTEHQVWEIRMWNPHLFNLYLFTYFSPVVTFILYTTSYTTLFKNLILSGFTSIQIFFLVRFFLQQVNDKSLVFGEMFDEYEKKVVRPKMSAKRRDVAIGTDGNVEFSTPALDRTFTTHSILPTRSHSDTPSSESPFSKTLQFATIRQTHVPDKQIRGAWNGSPLKFRPAGYTPSTPEPGRSYQPSPLSKYTRK